MRPIRYYGKALEHRKRELPHKETVHVASIFLNLAISYYNKRDFITAGEYALPVQALRPEESTAEALLQRIERRRSRRAEPKSGALAH